MIKFQKPIQEIIRERTSWRTFTSDELSEIDRKEIERILNLTIEANPFGGKNRFKLFDIPDMSVADSKQQYGTYGFIQGARSFVLGACETGENDYESFGYAMELIILKLTELGLGTCWLGGTFTRTSFSEAMQLNNNEMLPAITPVGYIKNRRIKERVIRLALQAKKRKPWDRLFFKSDFSTPLNGDDIGEYATVLEMVRLAPSARNRQPWRIIHDGNRSVFHFYRAIADSNLTSGYNLYHRMDLGIAVAHFDLMVKELNLRGKWNIEEPLTSQSAPDLLKYVISWEY